MSKNATRFADLCTGHVPHKPRPNVEGSPNVFINDLNAHRRGDRWNGHGGVLAAGSPDVFVNDRQQGRVGDPVSCGSFVLTGSPDVFVNG